MPFLDSRKREMCRAETVETIAMIESIIDDHPNHLFVISGDLTCELNGNSPFDENWNNLASRKQLTYCSHLFSSPGYTYHHETLGQKKLNDHFIVSRGISESAICSNHTIIEDGQNPSDHLPISMIMSIEIQPCHQDENEPIQVPTLKWSKVSNEDKSRFLKTVHHCMSTVESVIDSFPCKNHSHCDNDLCKSALQFEYDFLIDSIKAADKLLPRHSKGREKNWWTAELSDLKRQSIQIQNLWLAEGRPGIGPTHLERLRVRAAYRKAIKEAQEKPQQDSWNKLHAAMEDNDTFKFWHSWKTLHNKNNSGFAAFVDGSTSKPAIADSFRKAFLQNCKPNNASKVNELNDRFASKYSEFCSTHAASCKCHDYKITLSHVIDAICGMKEGKCADEIGLSAEHFHNTPLSLLTRLTSLFNSMLQHAFVPTQFRLGFMIPIVKDRQGSHSDVGNYRGITISPVVSKIFEHVLKAVFSSHLNTSEYQFGFKKKKSTTHALHCLRETINYYIDNGSQVFCSFLDASKAFDRLVHSGLFLKLLDRNVPKIFLDIIMSWHVGLMCRVRWDNVFSEWFHITAGVRQGGVLSPDLYSIYVDELVIILQRAGIGCHIRGIFAACLFYADDIAVLAPSVKGLQKILNLCHTYCIEWDILLNVKKTMNMMFGKGTKPTFNTQINNVTIPWVDHWKYLGVTLKSGLRFGCCVKDKLASFYRSINAILRIDGHSDEIVRLRLLESHYILD